MSAIKNKVRRAWSCDTGSRAWTVECRLRAYAYRLPPILKRKVVLAKIARISLLFLIACTPKTHVKIIATEEELGEALFFDSLLSRDSSVSCSSCHKPEYAFADNVRFSKGVRGQMGERNTPSAMNQSERNFYFWDGRAESLEEQALGPIENHNEMDLPLSIIIRRLITSHYYSRAFSNVYGKPPSKELLAEALAAYERSLETGKSSFDVYMKGEDTSRFSASAKRGLSLFNGKGRCFSCHFGVDFTGSDQFKNIGLYNGKKLNDPGRFKISGKQKDLGAFKVPGLRNVAQTAPYMHNGMFGTLKQVIGYYDAPDEIIHDAINRDTLLRTPLQLSISEKQDLENFLLSLSDKRFLK